MPFDPERLRPVTAVRGTAGRWVVLLVLASAAMVAGAVLLVAEAAPDGILTALLTVVVLGGFVAFAAGAAQVTTRWRTSLRSDGWSLVVRSPFAVAEHSYAHELSIGRWLDSTRGRPEHWVIESGTITTPIGDAIDPVRVEAFAHAVGVPLVDVPGSPPSASTRVGGR
jgi:hypothetical protein